jgi:hypothetical protein
VAERHRRRRPGYEDYSYFPSRRPNRCTQCGTSLPIGVSVLGRKAPRRHHLGHRLPRLWHCSDEQTNTSTYFLTAATCDP